MKLSFKLEFSEDHDGNAVFGFHHDGFYIFDPFLDTDGMTPADPMQYGISLDEAAFLAKLNGALEDATEAALNAGCLRIQDALGVKHGDYAGIHFSGGVAKQQIRQTLGEYFKAELEGGDARLDD
ncbi:hypothetical protein F6X40_17165 [Paraburkholderia sp. UCT31]|uniref:hypothetical protein n=1 Tax=Paraburkholderia sp. UCT31 TaxID=2615209 RepID=UPI0016553EF2|nr:hypothetical protein [Paraburkholderia sp. UCT31]MBC8738506.1 hypothetical protein [Paraburkholderia sp. UCT31]